MFLLFLSIISTGIIIWTFLEIILPKKISVLPIKKTPKSFFYYGIILVSQLFFMMFVIISSQFLTLDTSQIAFEKIVIKLLLLSFYLILLGILIFGIKILFRSIFMVTNYINLLSEDRKEYRGILGNIVLGIIIILLLPIALFALLYGSVISFAYLPESFNNILQFKYVYYSIAVSYSLPSDGIIDAVQTELSYNNKLKIIPSIQAIIQKVIDIFLLGYIATILTNVIWKSQKR